MKSFLSQHIRNLVRVKFAISAIVVAVSLGVIFMMFALAITVITSPIETVKFAVTSFFSGDDSPGGNTDEGTVDLRDCLAIKPSALREITETVPPGTDIETAWAWIAWRTEELTVATEPAYDSIIAFSNSAVGQLAAAAVETDPDAIADAFAASPPTGPTLAAMTGVIDLVEREILTASDEDTVSELSAVLADQCIS